MKRNLTIRAARRGDCRATKTVFAEKLITSSTASSVETKNRCQRWMTPRTLCKLSKPPNGLRHPENASALTMTDLRTIGTRHEPPPAERGCVEDRPQRAITSRVLPRKLSGVPLYPALRAPYADQLGI